MFFAQGHKEDGIAGTLSRSKWRLNLCHCVPASKILEPAWRLSHFQKILVSVELLVRDSGAGNGCANSMGAWKHAFFLQEKAMSVHKIPRFRGGGVFWVFGGGECRFYFYGREDFSDTWKGVVSPGITKPEPGCQTSVFVVLADGALTKHGWPFGNVPDPLVCSNALW